MAEIPFHLIKEHVNNNMFFVPLKPSFNKCLYNLHRTLMTITLSGNGLLVTLFQPRHLSSDPLSVLLNVTSFTPPSSAAVILVFPLYHWYLAEGCLVSHVKDSGIPDITLIEFEFGVDFNNTRSMGTETTGVIFVKNLHISNITKNRWYFHLCRSSICWEVATSVKKWSVYCLHSIKAMTHDATNLMRFVSWN